MILRIRHGHGCFSRLFFGVGIINLFLHLQQILIFSLLKRGFWFMKITNISILALLSLLVLVLFIPINPAYFRIPYRDSGVFLYIGQRILDGNVPYRDIWDHKGPIIFYINALGLFIGNGSRWGVWFLEFASISMSVYLCYFILFRTFNKISALFGSVLWLFSLKFVIDGGNLTEEYAILFSFVALYLFFQEGRLQKDTFLIFIGFSLAINFLLRPNLIGMQISIIIYYLIHGLVSHKHKENLLKIGFIIVGCILILIPIFIFFYINGAFFQMVEAVLNYNMLYSRASHPSIALTMSRVFSIFSITFVLPIFGWLLGIVTIAHKSETSQLRTDLLSICIINLPIELFLVSASGSGQKHYLMTLMPAIAVLTTWLIYKGIQVKFKLWIFKGNIISRFATITSIIMMVCLLLIPNYKIFISTYKNINSGEVSTVRLIKNYVGENDYLLMWGQETVYNFLTEREAPTRYVYQFPYPFSTPGYFSKNLSKEFIDAIEQKRPIIIDVSISDSRIPPLDDEKMNQWITERGNNQYTQEILSLLSYIDEHYQLIGSVGKWPVYGYSQ